MSTTERASSPNRLNITRKTAGIAAAGAAVSALLLSGCSAGEQTPKEQVQTSFVHDYEKAYANASPVGKFALQYLGQETRTVREYPDADFHSDATKVHGNSYAPANMRWVAKMNDGCLGDTAYDVNGGKFKVTGSWWEVGLFSTGEGKTNGSGDAPSAAAFAQVNPQNKDQLIVQSGHANSVPLVFNGLTTGDELTPADEPTKNILYTYGCNEGLSTLKITEHLGPSWE